jgi:hypothetical protein
VFTSLWSFQGARYAEKPAAKAGLSKLNSVRTPYIEVNVFLGDSSDRTAEAIKTGGEPPEAP